MTGIHGLRLVVFIFCLKFILADTENQFSTSNTDRFSEECGISNAPLQRIVGGSESSLYAWPWMAAIFIKKHGLMNLKHVHCGGAIITRKHVLTAAHCLVSHSTDDFLFRLGEHDVCTDSDGAVPIDFTVSEIFIHEKYQKEVNHFDIAIVRLHGTIQFSDAIRPICLPTMDMRDMTFQDMWPFIAGWGRLAYRDAHGCTLRQVQLEVIPNEVCGIAYAVITQIKSNQLCTGYKMGGRDACQGDSGGPLMIPINNRWYSIGVVSVGIRCADQRFPGIFTRTTFFVDWIKDIIGYHFDV